MAKITVYTVKVDDRHFLHAWCLWQDYMVNGKGLKETPITLWRECEGFPETIEYYGPTEYETPYYEIKNPKLVSENIPAKILFDELEFDDRSYGKVCRYGRVV